MTVYEEQESQHVVNNFLIHFTSLLQQLQFTGKVGDRKSLSFLSVLTVSSISTKNDRKMTKFFDDEI